MRTAIPSRTVVSALILLLASSSAWANSPIPPAIRVSIGAVTKYTGSSATQTEGQDFLATLETQMAAGFLDAKDIDYLDRSNLDALLRELHVSSASVFDQSSGALRGLLGRLDLLIVIEASTTQTARVRVVDVERGAVKAVAICEASTAPSKATPACVQQLLTRTLATAKEMLAVRQNRLAKAEAERRAAKRASAEQERTALEEQQEADRKRTAEEQAAKEQQAEVERQLDGLRPGYDDAVSRLSAEESHWGNIGKELSARGLNLRTDVQSALSVAKRTANRCSAWLANRNPGELSTCLDEFNNNLHQLEKYR
jgi:hypothetical protein